MTICNVMPCSPATRQRFLWRNKNVDAWEGKVGGRKVTVAFERNTALRITEVVVCSEVLPGLPYKEVFRSRVEGWLKPPYSLEDARKAVRHFAKLE